MESILDLLNGYCTEISMRMRLQLRTIVRGSLVRTNLPQAWNFKTEAEEAYFLIDKDANASARAGRADDPDLTIEWKHDLLASVLRNRNLDGIPAGEEPKVVINSVKGRIGYAMIRRHLGFP